MARPHRHQEAGATYHVFSRGTEGRPVYLDDVGRVMFFGRLADCVERYDWQVYAYCQMTNHFHMLIRIAEANLAVGMHRLNGWYAQWFNDRYGHVGHLFQSRYSARLIETDDQLLAACRYVVLNPVRAG